MAKIKETKLPQPVVAGQVSLEETILKRHSVRRFKEKDLKPEQLSQLFWAGRRAPSAGALYPMEFYLVSKEGFFRYIPDGHKLEVLTEKDLRKDLAAAALNQDFVAQAPVDIIICAVYERITHKYGERGIRYAHIEAGHIAQNIHLQAVALNLGSVSVGAFNDREVQKVLSLPQNHEPLYIIPVGYPD